MEGLREYVLGIMAAAALGAVLLAIVPEKAGGKRILQTMCGLVVTLAAVMPLGKLRLDPGESLLSEIRMEAHSEKEKASREVRQEMTEVITGRTASYIEDKARDLGAEVVAEITLDEDLKPWSARIQGQVSAYIKDRLGASITGELGIPKERQVWISR